MKAPDGRFNIYQSLRALTYVTHLSCSEVARGQEGRGGQGVDPVLAPELVQQDSVQAALEVADVQAVVGVGVHPKVLYLAERDGLVLRGLLIWRLVVLHGDTSRSVYRCSGSCMETSPQAHAGHYLDNLAVAWLPALQFRPEHRAAVALCSYAGARNLFQNDISQKQYRRKLLHTSGYVLKAPISTLPAAMVL